jgi:hypothetical protein
VAIWPFFRRLSDAPEQTKMLSEGMKNVFVSGLGGGRGGFLVPAGAAPRNGGREVAGW